MMGKDAIRPMGAIGSMDDLSRIARTTSSSACPTSSSPSGVESVEVARRDSVGIDIGDFFDLDACDAVGDSVNAQQKGTVSRISLASSEREDGGASKAGSP